MIGKKIKLLIPLPIYNLKAGDEGIIEKSCGCSIPGWKVKFPARIIELKQHDFGRTYVLVDEAKEAV